MAFTEGQEVCYYDYNYMRYRKCFISKDLGNGQLLTYVVKNDMMIFSVINDKEIIDNEEFITLTDKKTELENEIQSCLDRVQKLRQDVQIIDNEISKIERF